ncbi:MAG: hypothetical protein KatS3mg076_1772 [Candidatus Binatia bacterium]|nr:MAG: hypothetical protein KatS3mg076_1772 [Candidatus Binatia bacterium]
MRRANSLLGLVGLLLLFFAGAAYLFTRGRSPIDVVYIGVHAGFGVLALVAFLSSGLESLGQFVGQRSTKYGANVILYSAAFLAVLAVLNYLSARHHLRFDLTEQKVYSLSPQSERVVKALEKPLVFRAFVEGGVHPQLEDLLRSYTYASDKVSYRMIDPERDPVEAEKYKIRSYNSVHVEYGDEGTVVTEPTEENLTNAIIKVTRGKKKTVCFAQGHGEPDVEDVESPRGYGQWKEALETEHYQVRTVLLMTEPEVPEDCDVLVVAAPEKPYLGSELDAIERYLAKGGNLLALIPPRRGEEFRPLLARWGVQLHEDVVVDQVLRLFQGPTLGLEPLVQTYGAHEITKNFRELTIFPMTRSVSADAAGKKGLEATEIVKTGSSSWAETDLRALFEERVARLDASDRKGPVSIGVAVEADLEELNGGEGRARLVVFGSGDFANNRNVLGNFYNRDLLLNSVGWLAGESDLISIRPKSLRASRVQLTPEQSTMVFYLSVLLFPEALLLAGLAVYWRRSQA